MAQSCRWHLSPGHMTLATLSYIISTASRRPYIKSTTEREEDGTLPFRMCLWLTIHKATPYRLQCTENQQIYPLSILPPLFHQECMESFKSCSINQKDHMPGSRPRFLTLLTTDKALVTDAFRRLAYATTGKLWNTIDNKTMCDAYKFCNWNTYV